MLVSTQLNNRWTVIWLIYTSKKQTIFIRKGIHHPETQSKRQKLKQNAYWREQESERKTFNHMIFRSKRRISTNITNNSSMDFTSPSTHTQNKKQKNQTHHRLLFFHGSDWEKQQKMTPFSEKCFWVYG